MLTCFKYQSHVVSTQQQQGQQDQGLNLLLMTPACSYSSDVQFAKETCMHACTVMLCLLALTAKTKQGKGLNTSSIQLAVEGIKRQRHKRTLSKCGSEQVSE